MEELIHLLCSTKIIQDIANKKKKVEPTKEGCEKLLVEVYIKQLFVLYDQNGDNKVSYEEFSEFMNEQSNHIDIFKSSQDISLLESALFAPTKENIKSKKSILFILFFVYILIIRLFILFIFNLFFYFF